MSFVLAHFNVHHAKNIYFFNFHENEKKKDVIYFQF